MNRKMIGMGGGRILLLAGLIGWGGVDAVWGKPPVVTNLFGVEYWKLVLTVPNERYTGTEIESLAGAAMDLTLECGLTGYYIKDSNIAGQSAEDDLVMWYKIAPTFYKVDDLSGNPSLTRHPPVQNSREWLTVAGIFGATGGGKGPGMPPPGFVADVVSADLDVAHGNGNEVDETVEEAEGAFFQVGTNMPAKLTLRCLQNKGSIDGWRRVELRKTLASADVHVYTNAALTCEVTDWPVVLTQGELYDNPRFFYVTSDEPSTEARDIEFEAWSFKLDTDSYATDRVRLTALKVDLAMDGNRDDTIDFDDPDDAEYLFWVNDDVDVISDGEEDDAASGTVNCNDNAITCKRDLEDFTRLHIKADDIVASLSGITYFLKFENVSSGSPSVNIFEAVGESAAYLSDTNVAADQIEEENLTPNGVGTTEVQIDAQYIKTGNQVSPFIIEGRSAGKGDLTFIVKKDGNEVCKKAVALDLRPITEFYEKYVVTVSTGDNVNSNTGVNANSTTYAPETDEYVFHVHGWNMAGWEKDRWTETVFKRLWWQNYKGHVGSFQWPTYTGTLTYDASELRAWRSGIALNNRITSLNESYSGQVRILAHSMGNVVMGEALRLFSSSAVHTYIAAQAAIPAHCYDSTVSNYWTGFNTPDIYARYSSGLSPDTPYLAANSSHAGAMVLYFNSEDYALDWWEFGNEMKPDISYWYTEGDTNVASYAPASGDRFYFDNILVPFDERTMTIPDDRFEIFARIVESRSRALGCEASVNGFGTARNLQNWGYNEQHYSHSREFRSNVSDEWLFWTAVIEDAYLNE